MDEGNEPRVAVVAEAFKALKKASLSGLSDQSELGLAEDLVAALEAAGMLTEAPSAVALAQLFHGTYERLAPDFGYETRQASAVPWDDVPEPNRLLMVAVAAEVLRGMFGAC